ncbi:MAG TPA: methyltransferase domain-containing protein [Jatrophihabitans sp.]|jgi:SAM-dependent methyltransferase
MTTDSANSLSTGSSDYGAQYYQAHLGSSDDYSWETPSWRNFFTNVAGHLVSLTNPSTVLDVGCARGLLVQAFVENGVDAYGIDISAHAIESASPAIRDRLSVQSADKITGSWDLITSVEVVEHMSPADAEAAIDAMCAASNRVLLSSDPGDFAEATHVNVRPSADWAALFAERGFYRRTDVDLSFLTPWAILFERADATTRDVVYRYEQWAYPMRREVLDKRTELLRVQRQLNEAGTEAVQRAAELRNELADLRHDELTTRDHIVGLEAEASRLRLELHHLRIHAKNLEFGRDVYLDQRKSAERERDERQAIIAQMALDHDAALKTIYASRTWRVGSLIMAPVTALKRLLRRG